MNTKQYNEFAAFWQQLVSITKVAFASKTVTATVNFKQAFKHTMGAEYEAAQFATDVPIAVEPMSSKCRAAAIGCYIIMQSGRVYEGIIRNNMSQGKGIVHLVWFVAKDAKSRPLVSLATSLLKDDVPQNDVPQEEVTMKQE